MTTGDDGDGLSRRQKVIWAIVGLMVLSSTVALAETFTGGFNTYESPGKLNASAGPEVTLGQDFSLEGGQPATSASINLSKEDTAWLNVSGEAGGSSVTVDVINNTVSGVSWTNVSSASVSSANVTFQPSDKNFTTIGDGVTALKFTDAKVNDSQTDAIYSSSGTGTLVFETNATDGVQYGLIAADTDEGLDIATAQSDGTIHFTDVPGATNQEVVIQDLGTLTIREELEDHPKISSCTVNALFFETGDDDNPTIVNKSTSNGEIDLTGLPVDEEFVVNVQCAGYHNRTILLPDLSQQETAYLLNKSDDTVNVTFDIQDNTGQFSEVGTDLVVQRAINRSLFSTGGFSWDTMAGDEIGASTTVRHVLNREARYRLEITNEDGDTRILGAHVADTTTTVTIRINSIDVTANQTQDYNWNFTRVNDSGTQLVQFAYIDNLDQTTSVELEIHEFGNDSRVIHDQTHTGTYGELIVTEQLTGDDRNRTWVAVFTATRGDDTVTGRQVAGRLTDPLDVAIDAVWKHRIALLSLVLVGFLVGAGVSPAMGGIAVVATAGMWFYIEWMPAEVTAAAITLASIVAVGYTVWTKEATPVR